MISAIKMISESRLKNFEFLTIYRFRIANLQIPSEMATSDRIQNKVKDYPQAMDKTG